MDALLFLKSVLPLYIKSILSETAPHKAVVADLQASVQPSDFMMMHRASALISGRPGGLHHETLVV